MANNNFSSDFAVGKPCTRSSYDDESDTIMKYNGTSWTITRKDIRNGAIERFTQIGTGPSGRIELIHGKGAGLPLNAPVPDAFSALKRETFGWVGVEDLKRPYMTSRKPMPLPKSMRDAVSGTLLTASTGDALENLLPDSTRREMKRENVALAAKLNAEERRPSPRKSHAGAFSPH